MANGEPLTLNGVNRHEVRADEGRVFDEAWAREDLALMPLIQAESGLNWIEYQYGATRSMPGADWCLDVFFGEHTRWFTRPPGRDYLAWLDDAISHH